MGTQGLGWDGDGFKPGEIAGDPRLAARQGQLDRGRHSEVNLNVVSKRVLGLPDPK